MDREPHRIKHTVIVPAYNEEEGIAVVLDKIFRVIDDTYEVIVVDDGSTDRTAEVASRFPCRVICHDQNMGKGEALKTAFRAARGPNVIWIDADDTYPAELILTVAEGLRTYDMVVGSRILGRNNIPWINRLGNWMFRTAIRRLYRFAAFDPLTGLWGLRKEFASVIAPTVRYAPDAEMAMKAGRLGLRVLDIPLQYGKRVGSSKLPPIRAGWEHTRLILSLLFWRPSANGAAGTTEGDGR